MIFTDIQSWMSRL